MKISKLRTQWIIILSMFFTASTCFRSTLRYLTGTTSRAWVDKALQAWASHILNLVRVKCKIINPHKVKPKPGVPTMILCNHASLYDIPISLKAFPDHSIRMLSKKELYKIPIMGKGMKAAEFPSIDRKNRHQAMKDMEAMSNLMKSGIIVWIAPEGTRSKDGKLAAFKKGAFITAIETKATIIPLGIRGAYNILPAKTTQFNLNQNAEIHIGKPVDAAQYSLENKDELIHQVRTIIKELIGDDS